MPFELARQILQRRCYRPPDVDGHACTVEVTMFDLRPFADVAWIQEDGTKVFLAEAERPRPLDGHGAGKDWEKVPPTWQGQPPGVRRSASLCRRLAGAQTSGPLGG